MKLILTRHGRTEDNENGVIQGHLPGKLTLQGLEQAKNLALRLSNEKIDHIYSSDLARAVDTAEEIAKYHPSIPIEITQELREKYLGEWQGLKKSDIEIMKAQGIMGDLPKDGEKPEQLCNRVRKFLNRVLSRHSSDTVLFVAHQGINKALHAVITNRKPEDLKTMESQKNTAVNIYQIDPNGNNQVILFNCTKHLE